MQKHIIKEMINVSIIETLKMPKKLGQIIKIECIKYYNFAQIDK